MERTAQILSGLVALLLIGVSTLYLFNPVGAGNIAGLEATEAFGLTNLRGQAAPLLAIGVMAAIGAVRKNFVFVAPAALYFLFTAIIRIVGLAVDGSGDGSTLRGLILAVVLFAVAEFALQVFKKTAKAGTAAA